MILVVRGHETTNDPAYRCVTRDTRPAMYGVVCTDEAGMVTDTQFARSREEVLEMLGMSSRPVPVYIDSRRDGDGLLPMPEFRGAYDAKDIIDRMLRTRTSEEMDILTRLDDQAAHLMTNVQHDATKFRSASSLPSFAMTSEGKDQGFTNLRYGTRDPTTGMCVDRFDVIPRTPAWEARMQSVRACMDEHARRVVLGASFHDIDADFRSTMADRGFEVHSTPVFASMGYGLTTLPRDAVVEPTDVLSMTAHFSSSEHDEAHSCWVRRVVLPHGEMGASYGSSAQYDFIDGKETEHTYVDDEDDNDVEYVNDEVDGDDGDEVDDDDGEDDDGEDGDEVDDDDGEDDDGEDDDEDGDQVEYDGDQVDEDGDQVEYDGDQVDDDDDEGDDDEVVQVEDPNYDVARVGDVSDDVEPGIFGIGKSKDTTVSLIMYGIRQPPSASA